MSIQRFFLLQEKIKQELKYKAAKMASSQDALLTFFTGLRYSDSHFTCEVANKCLNVHERVEVVEWNKRWSPPFPCCPVSCQCP